MSMPACDSTRQGLPGSTRVDQLPDPAHHPLPLLAWRPGDFLQQLPDSRLTLLTHRQLRGEGGHLQQYRQDGLLPRAKQRFGPFPQEKRGYQLVARWDGPLCIAIVHPLLRVLGAPEGRPELREVPIVFAVVPIEAAIRHIQRALEGNAVRQCRARDGWSRSRSDGALFFFRDRKSGRA